MHLKTISTDSISQPADQLLKEFATLAQNEDVKSRDQKRGAECSQHSAGVLSVQAWSGPWAATRNYSQAGTGGKHRWLLQQEHRAGLGGPAL